MVILIVLDEVGRVHKSLKIELKKTKSQRKNQNHPDYDIVAIGLETERSHGGWTRVAITLLHRYQLVFKWNVKNKQIVMVWKSWMG